MSFECPMFPLGTVLFPHQQLPIHVFEPRYRTMVEHCLAGERELGVVLIERGSEVGGGDARFAVGTLARIDDVVSLADGRYLLGLVGTRRIRVDQWLPDDPYPRARVSVLDDAPPRVDLAPRISAVTERLGVVADLASRLGIADRETDDPARERSDDPSVASFQLGASAPLGPLDAQRVLEAATVEERLDLLEQGLDEVAILLRARLDD